jgi:hypothetical protein
VVHSSGRHALSTCANPIPDRSDSAFCILRFKKLRFCNNPRFGVILRHDPLGPAHSVDRPTHARKGLACLLGASGDCHRSAG